MKTQEQIEAAEQEAFDRRWYDRSSMLAPVRGGADPGAEGRLVVEEKYGADSLGPYTDYEWAFLAGKHAALRWVLHDAATWHDDWLGDT